MKWTNMVAGFLLIVAGVLGTSILQDESVIDAPTNFQDEFPHSDGWTANGTLDGLQDDDGTLVVESGEDSGTFTSDKINGNEIIQFEQAVADFDRDPNDESNITITAYDSSDTELNSTTFTLEDGRQNYDLNLIEEGETAATYSFEITLQDNAELSELVIEGKEQITEKLDQRFREVVLIIMVLIGIVVAFKG